MTILYHTPPSPNHLDPDIEMSKYYDRDGNPLNLTFTSMLLGTYGGGTLRTSKARKVTDTPAYGPHD